MFRIGKLWLLWIALSATFSAHAAGEKIFKVLPHWLDLKGRHTLSPSLYERDAYQAHLRENRIKCSNLRFDIEWRAKNEAGLVLRIEIRGSKAAKPFVVEQTFPRQRGSRRWSSLTLSPDEFRQMGDLIAWRASLWKGNELLAEQKSFLW